MGGLFGGNKTQSNTVKRFNAMQISQSAYGNTIPLLYGTDRLPVILIDYQDFASKATSQKSSAGKGGGGQTTNGYTYSASWVGLLASGPIGGILNVYHDKVICTLATAPGGPLTLFAGNGGQAPWSYMTTNHPTHALSYDHTAYVAAANYSLGSSAAMPNLTFEVLGLKPYNGGPDAHPFDIISDMCTSPNHGVNFPYLDTAGMQAANGWRDYCTAMGFLISPCYTNQSSAASAIKELLAVTNSNSVWSPGIGLRIIPYGDQVVSNNGVTYTPNLNPIFSFIDDDYCPPSGQPPVQGSITPASQTYNIWNVEFLDRTNQYNTAIETYRDEQDIAVNGPRVAPTINLHAIKIRAIAAVVATLAGQRNIYIRSQYTFTVRADYSLLEPMDLVAINDSTSGIVNQLVRILETTDNPDESFTIVAEEMLVGPAHAPIYNTQFAAGYAANYGADAGPVDIPYIFAIPPLLTDPHSGGYEVGIAVGGTKGLWGGCNVYGSFDNITYQYIGSVTRASIYGRLDTNVGTGKDPDTVNTVNVTLNSTRQESPTSVSKDDADNLRSLMIVDGEVMAYQTSTPLGTDAFQLSYLRRGQYNTAINPHNANSQFALLDDNIFRFDFDPGYVGQPMWLKFQSFNIYGFGAEDLSKIVSYQAILQGQNNGFLDAPGATTLVARGTVNQQGDRIYKRPGTTAAWDGDCYSVDAFSGGCSLRFRSCYGDKVNKTGFAVFMGLNTDPKTDMGFTGIDYAFYLSNDPTAYIYENGAFVQQADVFDSNTVFEIRYDGKYVSYYMDGVLWRQTPAPNKVLFFDSSFNTPGAAMQAVYFGALNPATPNQFLANGPITVSDQSIHKNFNAPDGWDNAAISIEGYPNCHLSFKPSQIDGYMIVGLTHIPGNTTGTRQYSDIEYGFYLQQASPGATTGTWVEWLRGNSINIVKGTYDATTLFSLKYDGSAIRLYVNGTLVDTLADVLTPNQILFAEATVFSGGRGIGSVSWGPTTRVPATDTAEISPNAASQIISMYDSAGLTTPKAINATLSGQFYSTASAPTIVSTGAPVAVDCTLGFLAIFNGTGVTSWTVTLEIFRDGVSTGVCPQMTFDNVHSAWSANGYVGLSNTAFTFTDPFAPAGTHTYNVHYTITSAGGTVGTGITAQQISIKLREIKR